MKWRTFSQITLLIFIAAVLFYIARSLSLKTNPLSAIKTTIKNKFVRLPEKEMSEEIWPFPGKFKWGMSKKEVMKEADNSEDSQLLDESKDDNIVVYKIKRSLVTFLFTPANQLIFIAVDTRGDSMIFKVFLEVSLGEANEYMAENDTYVWIRDGDIVTLREDTGIMTFSNIDYTKKYQPQIDAVMLALGFSQGSKLKKADRNAKSCLERTFWVDRNRIARYTDIVYDPSGEPNYANMIKQFHSKKVMKREIIDAVGYDCAQSIIYILKNFQKWEKCYRSFQ